MFFDKTRKLFHRIFLIFRNTIPERLTRRAVSRVLHILIFNAPETFMFFSQLEHEIIDMIIKHMYILMNETTLFATIISRMALGREIRYEYYYA